MQPSTIALMFDRVDVLSLQRSLADGSRSIVPAPPGRDVKGERTAGLVSDLAVSTPRSADTALEKLQQIFDSTGVNDPEENADSVPAPTGGALAAMRAVWGLDAIVSPPPCTCITSGQEQ
eukprot:COSAG02_NODE_2347_length_9092_cov_4.284666_7_plen_120_part_00